MTDSEVALDDATATLVQAKREYVSVLRGVADRITDAADSLDRTPPGSLVARRAYGINPAGVEQTLRRALRVYDDAYAVCVQAGIDVARERTVRAAT